MNKLLIFIALVAGYFMISDKSLETQVKNLQPIHYIGILIVAVFVCNMNKKEGLCSVSSISDHVTCVENGGTWTPDVDCAGTWSDCTAACESSGDRTWTETVAQSGGGAACPTVAPDCAPGDGACPDAASDPGVDCAGTWSDCTAACESSGDRTWTETVAQSGGGAACPTVAPDCAPGDGACPAAGGAIPWGKIAEVFGWVLLTAALVVAIIAIIAFASKIIAKRINKKRSKE